MVTISEAASRKVLALLKAENRTDAALRVAIDGRGPGGFQYNLRFVKQDEQAADDVVVDAGGFKMFIDAATAIRPKILFPYNYGNNDPRVLADVLKAEPTIEVRVRDLK